MVLHSGELNRPVAAALRAACACGWRRETSYPLDWEMVDRHALDFYDTSAPHSDWSRHIRDDVEARAVPVPADLITPLDQVAQRLERLTDDEPLAAIRVMAMLEHIVKDTAPLAAQLAQADAEEDGTDIGRGLARSTSRPAITCRGSGSGYWAGWTSYWTRWREHPRPQPEVLADRGRVVSIVDSLEP